MEIQDWNKYTKLYVDTVMFDKRQGRQLDDDLYNFLVQIKPNFEIKHNDAFWVIVNNFEERLDFVANIIKLTVAIIRYNECYNKGYRKELHKMNELGGNGVIQHFEDEKLGKIPLGFERYYKYQLPIIDESLFKILRITDNLDAIKYGVDVSLTSLDFFAMLCVKYVYGNPRLFSNLL